MSEFLSFLVHQPLRLLMVAGVFLAAWLILRRAMESPARSRPLLVPSAYFAAIAGWEWWVMIQTPEADIRVDLLLPWPLALLVVIWVLYRLLRRPRIPNANRAREIPATPKFHP